MLFGARKPFQHQPLIVQPVETVRQTLDPIASQKGIAPIVKIHGRATILVDGGVGVGAPCGIPSEGQIRTGVTNEFGPFGTGRWHEQEGEVALQENGSAIWCPTERISLPQGGLQTGFDFDEIAFPSTHGYHEAAVGARHDTESLSEGDAIGLVQEIAVDLPRPIGIVTLRQKAAPIR